MENMLSSFWTGLLSSIAAGAVSSVLSYRYGQTSSNSLGFGILVAASALTLFYFYRRSADTNRLGPSKGVNIDRSQNITAGTISDSHIINSDKVTFNKK